MSSQHSIANMEGLQSSIVRGEADRVAELLGSQKLDELQKKLPTGTCRTQWE